VVCLSANLSLALVVLASLSPGDVRIVSLSLERTALGVGESIVHPATIATSILSVAVDELLLRKGDELARFDFVMSFESTS